MSLIPGCVPFAHQSSQNSDKGETGQKYKQMEYCDEATFLFIELQGLIWETLLNC